MVELPGLQNSDGLKTGELNVGMVVQHGYNCLHVCSPTRFLTFFFLVLVSLIMLFAFLQIYGEIGVLEPDGYKPLFIPFEKTHPEKYIPVIEGADNMSRGSAQPRLTGKYQLLIPIDNSK